MNKKTLTHQQITKIIMKPHRKKYKKWLKKERGKLCQEKI